MSFGDNYNLKLVFLMLYNLKVTIQDSLKCDD